MGTSQSSRSESKSTASTTTTQINSQNNVDGNSHIMPPQPKHSNAQVQPLTTALRNIIREYPPGGGVLRELVQNADDAGANKVEFVLDESTYTDSPLLHPQLQEYQGPALLAYNDSVFTERDFRSLSRIGDSEKVGDLTTTGKFGRGFNSVYNWTDGPSILSESSLCILDPHKSWSSSLGSEFEGGPRYTFVDPEDYQDEHMQNQLKPFKANFPFGSEFGSPFPGTVIRVPLRTGEQAKSSRILDPDGDRNATTPDEILDAFQKFSLELPSFMLFLRSIREITLRVGTTIYSRAETQCYNIRNDSGGVEPRQQARDAYDRIYIKEEQDEFDFSFAVRLRYSSSHRMGLESQSHEAILALTHRMRKTIGDPDLENWARKRKMIPWVTIATVLQGSLDVSTQMAPRGILSSTLPLPVVTNLPFHINARWSITPDRASLHTSMDSMASESSNVKKGAIWNQHLFEQCVVEAWVTHMQGLENIKVPGLTVDFKEQLEWDLWPRNRQENAPPTLWSGLLGLIAEILVSRDLKLLPVAGGSSRCSPTEALFCQDGGAEGVLVEALTKVNVQLVVIPKDQAQLMDTIQRSPNLKSNLLTPSSARARLTAASPTQYLSPHLVQILLDYTTSDSNFAELSQCTALLLPIVGREAYGSFHRGQAAPSIYRLPLDDEEFTLFSTFTSDGELVPKQIDPMKLSPETLKRLRTGIYELSTHSAVSSWSVEDGLTYCRISAFSAEPRGSHLIKREGFTQFVESFWIWLDEKHKIRNQLTQDQEKGGGLWLVPLFTGCHFRCLSTITEDDSVLDISIGGDEFGNIDSLRTLLYNIATSIISPQEPADECRASEYVPSLFTSGLSSQPCTILRKLGYISPCESPLKLFNWLARQPAAFWDRFTGYDRLELLGHLDNITRKQIWSASTGDKRSLYRKCLVQMRLFKTLPTASNQKTTERNTEWISLGDPQVSYVGLKNAPELEFFPGTIFLDMDVPALEFLTRRFNLFDLPLASSILNSYIIPSLQKVYQEIPSSRSSSDRDLKKRILALAHYIFDNFDNLDKGDERKRCISVLSNLQFIPAKPLEPTLSKEDTYISPKHLVDRGSTDLSKLFFPDEQRFADSSVKVSHYRRVLKQLGMVCQLTQELVLDRIARYRQLALQGTTISSAAIDKVAAMLSMTCPDGLDFSGTYSEYQNVKWIPGRFDSDPDVWQLYSMKECRDRRSEPLLGLVRPLILPAVAPPSREVDRSWARAFCWEDTLPSELLVEQLRESAKISSGWKLTSTRLWELEHQHRERVRSILAYILERKLDKSTELMGKLKQLEWAPIQESSTVLRPGSCFFEHARKLEPYAGQLDSALWSPPYSASCTSGEWSELLTQLGVRKEPTYEDLISFINQLEEDAGKRSTYGSLSKQELDVSIVVLELVAERFPNEIHGRLKAPNKDKKLMLISNLTVGVAHNAENEGSGGWVDERFRNPSLTPAKLEQSPEASNLQLSPQEVSNILHPKVPKDVAAKLRIPTVTSRFIASLLVAEEFGQNEERTATIADSLRRYTVESTFSEYLANAEDSGSAEQIAWLIDDMPRYSTQQLLSKELSDVQNVPSLFCFNDGCFNEEDFYALQKVGTGSKATNTTMIGRYGRGALTMYYWTSYPSFVSGEYFVIFDPQEKRLPCKVQTGKPYPGLRLRIKDLRENWPDQLEPFHGKFGFDRNRDFFKGTLFRFPVRSFEDSKNDPMRRSQVIGVAEMTNYLNEYYKEARLSLLFLKRVSSISFRIRSKDKPEWAVEKINISSPWSIVQHSEWVELRHMCITACKGNQQDQKANWCVAQNSLPLPVPTNLQNQQNKYQLVSKAGIAVSISEKPDTDSGNFQGRIFAYLPLPFTKDSDLQVHITGDWAMTSDRQHVAVDTAADGQGAGWNRWLVKESIVPIYIELLEQLSAHMGESAYYWWPRHPADFSYENPFSKLVATSLWDRIASTEAKLYIAARDGTPQSASKDNSRLLSRTQSLFSLLDWKPDLQNFFRELILELGARNLVLLPDRIRTGIAKVVSKDVPEKLPRELIRLLSVQPPPQGKAFSEVLTVYDDPIQVVNTILRHIVPIVRNDLPSLSGCKILPLKNETLATVVCKPGEPKYLYLQKNVESVDLRRIINYSNAIFLDSAIDRQVLEPVFSPSSTAWNVKDFAPSDLPYIVKHTLRNDLFESIEEKASWLEALWRYFTSNMTPGDLSSCLSELADEEILHAVEALSNAATFISFNQYQIGTKRAVLMPDDSIAYSLLSKFKGLKLISRFSFPPGGIQENEINRALGLKYLCRSLGGVASAEGFEKYIQKRVSTEDEYESLRELFFPSIPNVSWESFSHANPQTIDILKQIPVWPIVSNFDSDTLNWKSAENAPLAPPPEFCSLDIGRLGSFIDPEVARRYCNQLRALGVKQVTPEIFFENHVKPLVEKDVTEGIRLYYEQFLVAFDRLPSKGESINKNTYAIDGNGDFRYISSLYSHENRCFKAAFREPSVERERFLHPHLRLLSLSIWKTHLITAVTPDTFLVCARAIEDRASSASPQDEEQLKRDAETLLNNLQLEVLDQDPGAAFWNKLRKIKFIPVKKRRTGLYNETSNGQPSASNSILTSFDESVFLSVENIAWASKPICNFEPSVGSLIRQKYPDSEKPSCEVVIRHLQGLRSIGPASSQDIQDILKAVEESYKYLQERVTEFERIAKIREFAVPWLNLERDIGRDYLLGPSDIHESWVPTERICIGVSYEIGEIQPVRSFLERYVQLMRSAGVLEFHTPKAAKRKRQDPSPGSSTPEMRYARLMLEKFEKYRETGTLCDIDLHLVDEEQTLKAHKVILATSAPYFEGMFNSRMKEASGNYLALKGPGMTSRAVSALLNYVYTGSLQLSLTRDSNAISDEVDFLLEVLLASDRWLMGDVKLEVEEELLDWHWMRPDTVPDMLDVARDVEAKNLERECIKYQSMIEDISRRANK